MCHARFFLLRNLTYMFKSYWKNGISDALLPPWFQEILFALIFLFFDRYVLFLTLVIKKPLPRMRALKKSKILKL